MRALSSERLLEACLLAAIAFAVTSLPNAAAEDLPSPIHLKSEVKVPNTLKKTDVGLESRITKLEARSRKLLQDYYDDYDSDDDRGPPLLQGCSNATDTSQQCQQAKQQDAKGLRIILAVSIAGGGVFIVVLVIVCNCDPSCCKSKESPQPAPCTSAGSSKEVASASNVAGKQGMIEQAIKQGDPSAVAVAILGHLTGQTASAWPKKYTHWLDATKNGAALAGQALILVFYCQNVTQDAADKLCQLIWALRKLPQNNIGSRHVYGAVAGLELSEDPEDIQQLLDKCRRHGLSIWLPSGCWQEGSKHAASAGLRE